MQLPWKLPKSSLGKASLSLGRGGGGGREEGAQAEQPNWAELGHRLCVGWTCGPEAVESLLKLQLWGQESKGGKRRLLSHGP